MRLINEVYTQLCVLIVLITALLFLFRRSPVYHILSDIEIDTYEYPSEFHEEFTRKLVGNVSKDRLNRLLTELSGLFPDGRYYNSEYGYRSALYFYDVLQGFTIKDPGRFTVSRFDHAKRRQPSLIFRIQGRTDQVVVVGCHIDSINLNPFGRAPGVDDNLSGIGVILEAMYIFTNDSLIDEELENTLEFHFYAAEELGSLGSREVFAKYREENRKVLAMLQQDMTGYTKGSEERGLGKHFGVVSDYSSVTLTTFIKQLISKYSSIKYLETRCNKVCSDQISPLMSGYPGAYVLESTIEASNPHIHTEDDTLEWINLDHVEEHAKLVVAFLAELGFNEIRRADNVQDFVNFGYYDFLVLFSTNDTHRLVWCVILFTVCVSIAASIYSDLEEHRTATERDESVIPLAHSPRSFQSHQRKLSKAA
ncbi:DEKNAAC100629 [Brettanomyces naardenensis]|uniref:Peptide hydrolase n=1 Tax=Brettanomyces naardenensis TaxID=13370 RepID=A0A448YGD5_BRENA|nr:DEKNAAC100629 [Brettanomyces naardenensis]